MHLREEQLIAYLDGEADEMVKRHIEACDSCAAGLEPFIALQRDLMRALYRLHCPGSQVLSDYQVGLLAEGRRAAVGEHLAECPHCAQELEKLQGFLAESDIPTDGRLQRAPGS